MINLRMRTEYSFKVAYGKLDDVLDNCSQNALAITDRNSTFGHIQFYKKCLQRNIKPIYGVELLVTHDAKTKGKERPGGNFMVFIARNNEGLKQIYRLTTLATEQFYFVPRIDYEDIEAHCKGDVFVLSGMNPDLCQLVDIPNFYVELSQNTRQEIVDQAKALNIPFVATNDAYYQKLENKAEYETCMGRDANRSTKPMHVLGERKLKRYWDIEEAYTNTYLIANECDVTIEKAKMVAPDKSISLIEQCKQIGRIDFNNKDYLDRLNFELDVIEKKDFADYFYVIADLVQWAKRHMMVGPARGSSCGSLLCYGLAITDIDPLKYDLLFERFIDINRNDYPDIDIDFQDDKRQMIFKYLSEKYGENKFAQIGTLSKRTSKTCINETAKSFGISQYDIEPFKESIIERSSGDERSDKCIEDSWDSDVGKNTLEKYPFLSMANNIEGHCSHAGKHAAGVVVTDSPIEDFCSINKKHGECTIMLDKDDAEFLNILKIDALGLSTLTVIQNCLDITGKGREWLLSQPINRQDVFDILNNRKFVGIFQFEGKALQRTCKQLRIESIEDISSITSLSRPGPMQSGGDVAFINAKNGKKLPHYFHDIHKDITEKTYGVIVYQEQVMHLAKRLGNMSWKDVNALRKAIGKSKGQEAIEAFQEKFSQGAMQNGIDKQSVNLLWDQIVTMGGYAFNRSHAIAYSMLSYWTCLLKCDFPQEFAMASLRNASDDKAIKILREYTKNVGEFIPFDLHKSDTDWKIEDNILIGPLTGAKGIGVSKARDIKRLLSKGKELPPGIKKCLDNLQVPYADLFPCKRLFGDIYEEPERFSIKSSRPIHIEDIEGCGEFICICRIKEYDIRDSNSRKNVERRGGKLKDGYTKYMIMTVEDDTDEMKVFVDNSMTKKNINKLANVGSWFILKGQITEDFDMFSVVQLRELS